MYAISYPDEETSTNKEKPLRKSDFSHSVSLIVWTLRFLGCLPDFRMPSTPLRVMFILYSGVLLTGNFYFVHKYFSYEPMDNYTSALESVHFIMKSHERFYLQAATRANFIYMAAIQLLYWICAKSIYKHFKDWIKFEKLYYELTNESLLPLLKRKATIYQFIATVTIFLSTAAQSSLYLNVQVRFELAIFFFALLRYTDVLFLILMKAGSLSAQRLSELYIEEFNTLKENSQEPHKNRLAQYEALWLKLSELVRGTGNALAYVMFIHIIRYVVLGLFFSYIFWVRLLVLLQNAVLLILLGWIIEISMTYFCIWITTTSAYETQLQMNDLVDKLRYELNENENNPKFNLDLVEQVTSFQETVNVLQPKVKLLDYFSVDRHLLFVRTRVHSHSFVSTSMMKTYEQNAAHCSARKTLPWSALRCAQDIHCGSQKMQSYENSACKNHLIVELYLTYLIILVQFKIAEYSIKGSKF